MTSSCIQARALNSQGRSLTLPQHQKRDSFYCKLFSRLNRDRWSRIWSRYSYVFDAKTTSSPFLASTSVKTIIFLLFIQSLQNLIIAKFEIFQKFNKNFEKFKIQTSSCVYTCAYHCLETEKKIRLQLLRHLTIFFKLYLMDWVQYCDFKNSSKSRIKFFFYSTKNFRSRFAKIQ